MPQNVYAQIVCPRPKVWDFDEKRLHWASVVRVQRNKASSICYVNANEMTKIEPFFRISYYSENTSNHALGTGLAF